MTLCPVPASSLPLTTPRHATPRHATPRHACPQLVLCRGCAVALLWLGSLTTHVLPRTCWGRAQAAPLRAPRARPPARRPAIRLSGAGKPAPSTTPLSSPLLSSPQTPKLSDAFHTLIDSMSCGSCRLAQSRSLKIACVSANFLNFSRRNKIRGLENARKGCLNFGWRISFLILEILTGWLTSSANRAPRAPRGVLPPAGADFR